jgi:hypothetical protein
LDWLTHGFQESRFAIRNVGVLIRQIRATAEELGPPRKEEIHSEHPPHFRLMQRLGVEVSVPEGTHNRSLVVQLREKTMSDIDEATGLSIKEWNIGADDKGRVHAVWKSEDDYVVTPTGRGRWSLNEAGQSLGSFSSANEAAAAMPVLAYDPWEDIDGHDTYLYLKLAPTDFDEWVSDETDNVFLRRENGSWWLSVPNQAGQSEFPTRLRGMIAGLELYEASYAQSEKQVIASLGLDDSDWRVEIENGFIVATYLHDESITLQADDNSTTWALFNDEEIVGNYREAKAAAAAVPAPPMTI